jgi:hypothetical protein
MTLRTGGGASLGVERAMEMEPRPLSLFLIHQQHL